MSTTTITILVISGIVFYLFIGALICAIRRTCNIFYINEFDEILTVTIWPIFLMCKTLEWVHNFCVGKLENIVLSVKQNIEDKKRKKEFKNLEEHLQKIADEKATEINKADGR